MSAVMLDEEALSDLDPTPQLPSPDSPISLSVPSFRDELAEEGADEVIYASQLDHQAARPHTPLPLVIEPVESTHRPLWGLRSPMINRLPFYSDPTLSPLSPLRRQFSMPAMWSPTGMSRDGAGDADDELDDDVVNEDDEESSEPDSLAEDSKDVLVDRLNDLVRHLTAGRGFQGADITTLHAKVDEMERLIPGGQRSKSKQRTAKKPDTPPPGPLLGSPISIGREEAAGGSSDVSATPEGHPALPQTDLFGVIEEGKLEGGKLSPEAADRVVADAGKLNAKLTTVLENLKARSIESDHLHGMLIERAEGAAMRILELEKELSELEADADENESELQHLRLRMRAIEVMFNDVLGPSVDPVLRESIENWKEDAVALRESISTKKKDRKDRLVGRGDGDTTITTTSSALSGLISP